MLINRIQARIFCQLCERQNLDCDEYVRTHSEHYLGRLVVCLENLTEEDGDQPPQPEPREWDGVTVR